jgi:PhzF family phenazine biosynthesis protein
MQTVYFVNAFTTDKPLTGNPAAICLLDKWLPDATMQAIAAQHNVSETAFVVPTASITTLTDTAVRAEDYHIRWFTPTVEIDLCGHATLATAHVLFEHLQVKNDCLVFASASGRLEVNRHPKLTLNFPARPLPACDNTLFSAAFGMSVQAFSNGHSAIVVCDSPQTVAQFQPSFAAIANLPTQVNYLTAKGDSYKGVSCDFVCRVFAPKAGIPEDPVTGSAYTSLGPYWAEQLGKPRLTALQLSARGGAVDVHVQTERVYIAGNACTILIGQWQIEATYGH